MGRLLGGAVAVVVLGSSAYALVFAVAVSPAGSWVREAVFDAGVGSCSADWVEVAQLAPALAAVVASGAALYRAVRPPEIAPARTVWMLAIVGLLLLVAWSGLQGAADCGLGRDD